MQNTGTANPLMSSEVEMRARERPADGISTFADWRKHTLSRSKGSTGAELNCQLAAFSAAIRPSALANTSPVCPPEMT